MPKFTRRVFFKRTSTGLAALGALATIPGLVAANQSKETTHTSTLTTSTGIAAGTALPGINEPMIAHVRDFRTGEISLMFGNQEVVFHDPAIVQSLLKAVR